MSWIGTPFAGYSCEFSPFHANLIAVGTAQYYGIVGNGKLHVYDMGSGQAVPIAEWLTNDGVYDVAWSEGNEHVLATGQGDGTIKLFDWARPGQPIMSLHEHTAEVYGVDWNMNQKNLISSAAWDNTVKVWDVMQGVCVQTYTSHQKIAYAAIWSPTRPACLATVAGDAMLHIQDLQVPNPVASIQAHQHEILTVDWNKYNENLLITGSVDKQIRMFDLRNLTAPVQVFHGHQLAVRRVKCHPHTESQFVSCSYDMSVNVWDINMGQMINHFGHHSEFVLGLDISLFQENLLASAAWDRSVCTWNCVQGPPPGPRPHHVGGQAPPPQGPQ